MFYGKQKSRIIKYKDYKKFNKITFSIDLLKKLSLCNLQKGDFKKFNVNESRYRRCGVTPHFLKTKK